MSSPIATLVCRLNDTCRHAAARAASIAIARGHHEVDIEHLLLALLEQAGSDFTLLCRRFGLDTARLQADLERELIQRPGGHARLPVFGARLQQLFEQAGLVASPGAPHTRIRSAHLLQALLSQPALRPLAHRASPQLARVSPEALRQRFDEAVHGSLEAQTGAAPAKEASASADAPVALASVLPGTPALQRYTTDLTQRARDGGIDPVIGRDAEIRQVMDILLRRRQNNPLLTGEAGVGKTAVVEGLALRIAAGEVAQALRGVAIHALDLGLLQAGAGARGEFEQRLRQLIAEVQRSPHPIVLFIDEAHTLVGAGGATGRQDAANLLKPALARGELRTIAATTWSEYKRHVEKDAALARRFQVVRVEEPSPALAAAMLRGLAPLMERHFGVSIRDEAITEAVRLSTRYLSERQLPDKAIGVLDTACARVALAQCTTPAAIDSVKHQLQRLEAEIASLQRDAALTAGAHAQRLQARQGERRAARARLDELCTRFEAERALVQELRTLHAGLQDAAPPRQAAQRLLSGRTALAALQAGAALVPLEVDAGVVAGVVADWTGIPLGRVLKDELRMVMGLERVLAQRVVRQPQALSAIAQRVRTRRAGLEDPDKPQGVFLFVGPSGVGKTETARALAEALCGGERGLIALRMSEYQEAHAVSTLKGSPPGYVGCGEGGVLTEAVRRQPYSVVLLDEADQAHPNVLQLFHQLCDQGVMDDAEGRTVDFRHCVIILTSHLDAQQMRQACATAGSDATRLAEALRPALARSFKPALLGRLTLVPYLPLDDTALQAVVRIKLDRIAERVMARHQVPLRWDEALVAALQARCTDPQAGARRIDQFLEGTLLPAIAEQLLQGLAGGQPLQCLQLGLDADGSVRCTAVQAARPAG